MVLNLLQILETLNGSCLPLFLLENPSSKCSPVKPIICGYYKKIKLFIQEIKPYGYEFGIDGEKTLEDEFTLIIEEKKKEQIYNEIKKFVNLNKNEFELIYERIKNGFLKPSEFLNFLNEYKEILGDFPLEKFLQIITKYQEAKIETEIKFQI
jgi:hypothetical protein